jgi:hypothetical protein
LNCHLPPPLYRRPEPSGAVCAPASPIDPVLVEQETGYDQSPAKLPKSDTALPACVRIHLTGTVWPALFVFHTTWFGVDMSIGRKRPWNAMPLLCAVKTPNGDSEFVSAQIVV